MAKFNFTNVYATLLTFLSFVFLYVTRVESGEAISFIRGFIVTALLSTMKDFYFGSSKDSQKKIDIIKSQAATAEMNSKETKGEVTIYKGKSIVKIDGVYRAMGSEHATMEEAKAAIDSGSTEKVTM